MQRFLSFLFSATVLVSTSFAQGVGFNAGKYNNNSETSDSPFSFKIGYNLANVLVSPEPMGLVDAKNGLHAGVVFNNIKLANKISIQPELLYSMQGFKIGGLGNVGLHYISLPVLIKLDMGSNASLLFGPQVSYLANARIGIGNDLFSVSYDGLFRKWDASGVAGLEYKVNDKIKLGGRYLLGLNDINKDFDLGQNTTFNDYFSLKNSTAQFYLTFNL
ncbi:MAG: porin family protein [Bacteroidota bacterium]